MTRYALAAPVLDPGLYPASAIEPLVRDAMAADPRIAATWSHVGLHLSITCASKIEATKCLAELLTTLTEAAMEVKLTKVLHSAP